MFFYIYIKSSKWTLKVTAWCLQINCSQVLRNCDAKTLPYPGFPTDLQPQLMALLTTCHGESILEETVFEGRMRHGMISMQEPDTFVLFCYVQFFSLANIVV